MKFIKTKGFYFNSDQILGFKIGEGCGSDNMIYYTVEAIPIISDYRDQSVTIEEFDRLKDAEKYLAELVAKLNAEEINHADCQNS